jgi:hypothetical protein
MLPGIASKRFVRDMADRAALTDPAPLSPKQAAYLEQLAWSFRRQMPAWLVPPTKPQKDAPMTDAVAPSFPPPIHARLADLAREVVRIDNQAATELFKAGHMQPAEAMKLTRDLEATLAQYDYAAGLAKMLPARSILEQAMLLLDAGQTDKARQAISAAVMALDYAPDAGATPTPAETLARDQAAAEG